MNFLLGALVILVILFPGFAFRLSYITKSYKHVFRGSIIEELGFAILPALVIQIPQYLIVNRFICNVDEQQLYFILINHEKVNIDSLSIGLFFLHTLVAIAIAIFLGVQLKNISLKKHWHLKYRFLKIYNDWQEYLDGFVLDRKDIPGSSKDVSVTWIDLLVSTNGKDYLYSGFLAYYSVTADEKLDRVFLKAVRRRKLDTDESKIAKTQKPGDISSIDDANLFEEESEYYYMPGDFFIILGDQIKNINITYFNEDLGIVGS